jgi:hypothetical protein
MKNNKGKIQFLLNEYIETHGSIDIQLPDGVLLEIGITQNGKSGPERLSDYCWVVTSRDDRLTILDRYAVSLQYDECDNCAVLDDYGNVTVV